MNDFSQGAVQAIRLMVRLDPELLGIILLSLRVSGLAVLLGALGGIPLGTALALTRFPGRRVVVNLLFTCMGLPPAVVGLVVYLLLSHSGPLGPLSLLFTPTAMIIAQTALTLPIIASLTLVGVNQVEPDLRLAAWTSGATDLQLGFTLMQEARHAIAAAVVTGFGRAIAEVGAVMLVGGNIKGDTRVMTTAIVLQTRQGDFAQAIALGIILLLLAFVINAMLSWLTGGREGVAGGW